MTDTLLRGKRGEKTSKIILTKQVPNYVFEKLCFGDFCCMLVLGRGKRKGKNIFNAALSISCHGVHFPASSIMQIGVLL